MHSHILPGIDDGCATLDESLESVRVLKQYGYAGTICTPHCWPMQYPHITPAHIAAWRDALQTEIDSAGLDYTLWTGGELRVYPGAVDWMRANGVPVLAGSTYVLCDFWEARWHKWIDDTFDWLMQQGYTPILAHPERSPTKVDYDKHLDALAERGVLLQGNLRCFTGEEGFYPDQCVRRYMDEGRYTLLALDMHRTDSLQGRLDGIALAAEDFGEERVNDMLDGAVRRLLLDAS
jgi:protein-tyrosine phosphatase